MHRWNWQLGALSSARGIAARPLIQLRPARCSLRLRIRPRRGKGLSWDSLRSTCAASPRPRRRAHRQPDARRPRHRPHQPGAKVLLGDRAVLVGEDGLFVFGFGRDQAPTRAAHHHPARWHDRAADPRHRAAQVRHPAHRQHGAGQGHAEPGRPRAHQVRPGEDQRGARRCDAGRGLPGAVHLAGPRAHQRRLWQPAHPERRAARAALRPRHRGARRQPGDRAGARHGAAGGQPTSS